MLYLKASISIVASRSAKNDINSSFFFLYLAYIGLFELTETVNQCRSRFTNVFCWMSAVAFDVFVSWVNEFIKNDDQFLWKTYLSMYGLS